MANTMQWLLLQGTTSLSRPQPSSDALILNELIREYLIYHGYRDTLSVFLPESGQPAVRPFDRTFLVCGSWDLQNLSH
jgi:hypothetical protein